LKVGLRRRLRKSAGMVMVGGFSEGRAPKQPPRHSGF
jgi:hypothetical protein